MLRFLRKADSASTLLLLGLFLIWNWRLANVAALNPEHIVRADLLTLFAWKTAFFAGLALSLYAVTRAIRQSLQGIAYALVFWLLGASLVNAVSTGAVLQLAVNLTLVLAVIFIVGFVLTRHYEIASRVAAVFGAVVCGMQAQGVLDVLTTPSIDSTLSGLEADLPPPGAQESLPHIIYIVPDRYASNANLRAFYGYSNEHFTAELETRGFHVWDAQNANYPKTFASLASTLNSEYLDPVVKRIPKDATSHNYLSPLIQDFAAQRALQARGYEYTHIGSWWEPTKQNASADYNFDDESLIFNLLTRIYLEQTPLVFLLAEAESQKTPCEIVDDKAALVRERAREERPQFVFWHSLVTHDPYIFDPTGACRDESEERYFYRDYDARTAAYLQHIEHFNRITLKLIDEVRADASRDIIIVIQSDEGPFPEALVRSSEMPGINEYDFLAAPLQEMQRKHGVFNAIYLPSRDYESAQALSSPVNNFRLIFRELTGADIPLLPDRAYSFKYDHQPYDLEDVSERIEARE